MCQQCVNAVKKYYPDLPDSEYGRLLMGATAYPFGSAVLIEEQVKELREATDGTVEQALIYAGRQLDKDMSRCRAMIEVRSQPYY